MSEKDEVSVGDLSSVLADAEALMNLFKNVDVALLSTDGATIQAAALKLVADVEKLEASGIALAPEAQAVMSDVMSLAGLLMKAVADLQAQVKA